MKEVVGGGYDGGGDGDGGHGIHVHTEFIFSMKSNKKKMYRNSYATPKSNPEIVFLLYFLLFSFNCQAFSLSPSPK